ncbi:Amino acid transporter [Entamoeba marina]
MSDTSEQLLLPSKSKGSTPRTYSSLAGFATEINYIIGTGVFGLPFAFYSAGIPLSAISLTIFFFLNICTMNYVLNSMSRAEGYTSAHEHSTDTPSEENDESNSEQITDEEHINKLRYRIYDYTSLGSIWGGPVLKYISFICLTIYMYGGLWAYAATTVSTLNTIFWMIYGDSEHCVTRSGHLDCQATYYGFLAIFSVIVISLSFVDLGNQGKLQMFLTFYRFFAFILMLITCIVQLIVSGPIDNDTTFLSDFKWIGFGTMFTHTAFALACHQNLPDAVTPIKSKRFLFWTTTVAMSISTVFYFLIGLFCSWTFNSGVYSPITNNWATYTGLNGGWGKGTTTWYAYPIQYCILCFPAINLCNTYPLVATSMSTNLQGVIPKRFHIEYPKLCKYGTKAVAFLPALLLTCAVGSLQVIFDLSGLFAIFLVFTFPPLFEILSRRKMQKEFGKNKDKTYYSFFFSHISITSVMFVLSFVLLVLSTYFLVADMLTSSDEDSSEEIISSSG